MKNTLNPLDELQEKGFSCRKANVSDSKFIVLLTQEAQTARRQSPVLFDIETETIICSERLAEDSVWSYVVLDEQQIIGVIMITDTGYGEEPINKSFKHLDLLMVDPKYWGQRIASILLNYSEIYLKDNKIEEINLWTEKDNERSHPLYESKGYILTGREALHPRTKEKQIEYLKKF